MTRERALDLAQWAIRDDRPERLREESNIAEVILAAVAEEREACAKIAAQNDCNEDQWDLCARHIAGQIRDRGMPHKAE